MHNYQILYTPTHSSLLTAPPSSTTHPQPTAPFSLLLIAYTPTAPPSSINTHISCANTVHASPSSATHQQFLSSTLPLILYTPSSYPFPLLLLHLSLHPSLQPLLIYVHLQHLIMGPPPTVTLHTLVKPIFI